MKDTYFTLIKNEKIAANTYLSVLEGDTSHISASGQFVNIKLDGLYLRRPISVCDVEGDKLTIIYKAVGVGTEKMAHTPVGEKWLTLTGLGNGYDLSKSGDRPLLIGGGAGVPPMYLLCKRLIECGRKPAVILGFGSRDEVFYEKEFLSLGADVFVKTVDGSYGTKGFVTDVLKNIEYDYFFTCGPMPMFRAIEKVVKTQGEYSFEERMGCGFGACMGCSCKTLTGNKRICVDGPVIKRGEIIW